MSVLYLLVVVLELASSLYCGEDVNLLGSGNSSRSGKFRIAWESELMEERYIGASMYLNKNNDYFLGVVLTH